MDPLSAFALMVKALAELATEGPGAESLRGFESHQSTQFLMESF
jgi:hypothetical protein